MSRFWRSWSLGTGLISNCPLCSHPFIGTTDHSQSRRHPAATDSSTTGVPPGRGRPPAQPRCAGGSANPATRTRGGRASRWTTREPVPCARSASGPGRERRAKPHLRDEVDPTGLTGRLGHPCVVLIMHTHVFRGTPAALRPSNLRCRIVTIVGRCAACKSHHWAGAELPVHHALEA